MNNSLFNAMTQMASNSIQPNQPLSLLAGMLNGGKSDNMILNMALGVIQNQNPQMAQQIRQALSSGQNPEALIENVVKGLNPQQVASVKQMLTQSGAPKNIIDKLG